MGGPAAVSEAVVGILGQVTGARVVRLAGADRVGTAAAVADHAFDIAAAVLLATGGGPADALAAGPVAARIGAPVLLADGPSLPLATVDVLRRRGRCGAARSPWRLDRWNAWRSGAA